MFVTVFVLVLLCIVLLAVGQGLYLTKYAVRLPEAKGQRLQNSSAPITLLHLGESPVAGVGVGHIEQGLTIQLVQSLQNRYQQTIDWQILAKNGAVVSDWHGEACLPELSWLVLSFGVNDSKKLTGRGAYAQGLIDCVDKYGQVSSQVVITSVPSLLDFPLLPPPLSYLLGFRAYMLNRTTKALCQERGWLFVDCEVKPNKELMAHDGFHPNEAGCKIWSECIAKAMWQHSVKQRRQRARSPDGTATSKT